MTFLEFQRHLVAFPWAWAATAFIALVLIEHAARMFAPRAQPSVALEFVADEAVRTARWLGRMVASISSFYTFLHLNELGDSVLALLAPLVKLSLAPFQVAYGYAQAVASYRHAYLIVGGTMTLACLPCIIVPSLRTAIGALVLSVAGMIPPEQQVGVVGFTVFVIVVSLILLEVFKQETALRVQMEAACASTLAPVDEEVPGYVDDASHTPRRPKRRISARVRA